MKQIHISVQGVVKKYENRLILDHLNLDVEKGSIHGILGPSGAGKSTLFRCLTLLERPTSGDIKISGVNLSDLCRDDLRKFRKRVGVIFQHFLLLGAKTALENVIFPLMLEKMSAKERNERGLELLEWVGLKGMENRYCSSFSGGQKQKVAIARALCNNPEILLCDEPTSSLDPISTKQILSLLRKVHRKYGVTIVLITHQLGVIKQMCDFASVLDHGKIVETQTVGDLLTLPHDPATKRLLMDDQPHPSDLKSSIHAHGRLIKLIFRKQATQEPLISEICKRFDIEVNILFGSIDHLVNESIGRLVVEMIGPIEEQTKAKKFLEERGVWLEVL